MKKNHPSRLFGLKALIASFGFAVLTGCLANYGRLEINSAVEQAFRNHEMLDHYQYYYSGRENKPSAIIGIDPAFQFSSKYWTAIEPSQFETMVGRMFPEYGFLYGAYILAPDGRKAGVWYSWVNIFTAKFEDDRIIVFSPEPHAEVDDGGFFEDR
ncbi:MAG: hypothetical protein WCF40_06530 [Desulfobacterales bacterium]|jgi:hypothetical protein